MHTRRLLPALALVVLLGSAPSTAAQEGPKMRIDEFNGFAWGTPLEAVIDALGAPARADTLPDGMLVYAYRDSVGGNESVAMYAVLEDGGLVKGQHVVAFPTDGDCEEHLRGLRNLVLLKYPMIKPEDRSRHDSPKAFCESVIDGDAAWLSTWVDPETGARAMVSIDAGIPRTNLIFESAVFLDWLDEHDPVPEAGS